MKKHPSDPLTWAQKQVESIPELNWKGKHIYSEKEMRKYWITKRWRETVICIENKYKKMIQTGFKYCQKIKSIETS